MRTKAENKRMERDAIQKKAHIVILLPDNAHLMPIRTQKRDHKWRLGKMFNLTFNQRNIKITMRYYFLPSSLATQINSTFGKDVHPLTQV